MKNLVINKNGNNITVTAIKMGENEVMDNMTRKYDVKYEKAIDNSGNEYTVYEHKGYYSYGYQYE